MLFLLHTAYISAKLFFFFFFKKERNNDEIIKEQTHRERTNSLYKPTIVIRKLKSCIMMWYYAVLINKELKTFHIVKK